MKKKTNINKEVKEIIEEHDDRLVKVHIEMAYRIGVVEGVQQMGRIVEVIYKD